MLLAPIQVAADNSFHIPGRVFSELVLALVLLPPLLFSVVRLSTPSAICLPCVTVSPGSVVDLASLVRLSQLTSPSPLSLHMLVSPLGCLAQQRVSRQGLLYSQLVHAVPFLEIGLGN